MHIYSLFFFFFERTQWRRAPSDKYAPPLLKDKQRASKTAQCEREIKTECRKMKKKKQVRVALTLTGKRGDIEMQTHCLRKSTSLKCEEKKKTHRDGFWNPQKLLLPKRADD